MANVNKTVIRETKYIALWVVLLSAAEQAFFLISGMWDYTVLLGNIFGGLAAVLNFLFMGLTVQRAVSREEKEAALLMRLSQTMRNVMLVIVGILAVTLPFFNGFAAIIPLFFPRIAIALISLRGRASRLAKVKEHE